MHTDELLVLLVKDPMVLSDDFAAQTVSLLEISPERNLMLPSSS